MVTDLLHDFPLHLFFFFSNYKTSRAYIINCSAPFSLRAVCPGKPSDEGVELCLLLGGCVVLPGKDVPSCNLPLLTDGHLLLTAPLSLTVLQALVALCESVSSRNANSGSLCFKEIVPVFTLTSVN